MKFCLECNLQLFIVNNTDGIQLWVCQNKGCNRFNIVVITQ